LELPGRVIGASARRFAGHAAIALRHRIKARENPGLTIAGFG
jgi:hypothetical protein